MYIQLISMYNYEQGFFMERSNGGLAGGGWFTKQKSCFGEGALVCCATTPIFEAECLGGIRQLVGCGQKVDVSNRLKNISPS